MVAALHGQGCGLLWTSSILTPPSPLHSGVDSLHSPIASSPLPIFADPSPHSQNVYFGKTTDILNSVRSVESLEKKRKERELQSELMGLWKR